MGDKVEPAKVKGSLEKQGLEEDLDLKPACYGIFCALWI